MDAKPANNFQIEKKQKLLQNYEAVLHAMHDMVFVLDKDWVFIDIFQPESANLYIPPEAFLQRKITEIDFPTDITATIQAKLVKIETSGQTQNIDYSLAMPGGKHYYNANISGIYAEKSVLKGFVMVVRDVTEQVKQQNSFKAIVEKYNLAEKSARFGAWELDYSTDEFIWNEGMEAIFQCKITTSQQYRDLWKNILDPVQYESLVKNFYQKQKATEDFTAEYALNILGETKYVEVFSTFKNNPATGEPEKATGIVLDITSKKKAEMELLKSEEQFRMVAENIIDMVVVLAPDSRRLYVSPSSYSLTGYHPRELLEGYPQQVLFYEPADRDVAWAAISTMTQGEGPGIAQFNFRHKNGTKITMEGVPKAIRDANGNINSYLISLRDVTKQAEAEKAMRKSEEQYRLLADNITDLVVLLSPTLERLYVSPSCLPLTGYTQAEFSTGTIRDLIHPEDASYFFNILQNTIYQNIQKITASYRIQHKQGYWVYVESVLKGIRNDKGELINILSTSRDITKQHETETAKRKSEELYRMLADNIVDMVVLLTTEHYRIYVSPSSVGLIGYTPQELLENQEAINVFFSDADQAILQKAEKVVMQGLGQQIARYHLKHKNGEKITVETVIKGITDDAGQIVNFLCTVRNITDQAKFEKALRLSEEKYRMLADNIIDMVALYNDQGKREYVSPSSKYLLGYDPWELLGRDSSDIMDAEDFERLTREVVLKAQQTDEEKFFIGVKLRHKQGHWLYCEITVKAIRNKEKRLTGFVATTRNITEWKKDQKALFESEQRYRMLADNISDMLILYNIDYSRSYVSPSSINVTGYTPEEIIAMVPFAIIHPDDINTLENNITYNVYNGFENFTAEFRILHKRGEWRYCSSLFTVIRDVNGLPVNVLSTVKDITAEKKARIALKENEEKYRSLVEASNDIILIMDENGRYLFGNEIACKKINTTFEELTAGTIYTFFDKETGDRYVNKVKQVLTTGQNITFEGPIVAAGQKLWLRNTLQPIYDSVANVYAVMLCLVDITDMKNYAEKLLAQNKELKKIAQLQSHIVRAPLANMEGLISLLDESNFTAENREYITLLKESALQLDTIVKEIVERAITVKQQ
jgi:PAS domain S-box-containing protein